MPSSQKPFEHHPSQQSRHGQPWPAAQGPTWPVGAPRAESFRTRHIPPFARRHDPRALAALCYTVPIVPAVLLLRRERHSRFLRFHAAQSLVFFAAVASAQLGLYLALLAAGSLIDNDALAVVACVLLVGLLALLGFGVLAFWFSLLADCVAGRARRLPVVGDWAVRIEQLTRTSARGVWPEAAAGAAQR